MTPVGKVLELSKLDISQPESIKRQAVNNFSLWGKRRKLDIEHIKSLRKKVSEKKNSAKRPKFTPTRIRPRSGQTIFIIASLLLFGVAFGFNATGLIAYDCANADITITSYSLLDVASC